MKRIITVIFCLFLALPSTAKHKKESVETVDLIHKAKDFKSKRVEIKEYFYSYTNLPLDYEKAMRSSEDYIGILISRPDIKEIPLVELKMVIPIKDFENNEELSHMAHGDLIKVKGKVFAVKLGEPWMDISSIEIIEKAEEEES